MVFVPGSVLVSVMVFMMRAVVILVMLIGKCISLDV